MPVNLCFLTKEENTCRLIMSRLELKGWTCFIQNDWIGLYRSLQETECKIDMIICDFTLIGSCYFNLFESILELGKKIPVIYYNDPVPSDDERIAHWISQNELCYSSKFPAYCVNVITELNKIICDKTVKRHISLLQPAVPVGFDLKKNGNSEKEIDLLSFRFRNNLTPVLFKLFEYMYKNRFRDLSLKELNRVLRKKNHFFLKPKNFAYAYISRLREKIKNDLIVKTKIIRSSPGYYRLIIF